MRKMFRSLSAVVLVIAAAGCGSQSPSSDPSSTPSSTPSTGSQTVAVYYLTDTPDGLRLAREFHAVQPDSGEALQVAVAQMLAVPPADPDYSSPWNPETQVISTSVSDSAIAVDLSGDARTANVGSEAAELAVQQLVYTATAAVQQDLPVSLLIEGEPAGELWGHVVWSDPVERAAAANVRVRVQINDPVEGASVPASFTVTGEAVEFEAVLPWQILDPDGTVVQEGTATTAEGQKFAPFEFRIDFTGQPGTYSLVVAENDPSDGAGGAVMTDDKTITIT